ncbi:MAG: nucleotidyltransferase family protein [Pseudomonadota bacterium]
MFEVLEHCDPHDLARSAQVHQVHTMVGCVFERHPDLAGAIPRDLGVYFRAMYHANQDRLAEGRAQLTSIAQAMSQAEVSLLAMKGGGDMLDPLHNDPAMRFVADFDILVPIDALDRAEQALLQHFDADQPGAKLAAGSNLNWRGEPVPEHHLPKFVSQTWTFPVELHMRVGSGIVPQLLPETDVLRRGVPTQIDGISVMGAEDRACHLIAHAAYHGHAVSLRAWVDWVQLRKRCDEASVRRRLAAFDLDRTLDEYNAVAAFFDGREDASEANAERLVQAFRNLAEHSRKSRPSRRQLVRRRLQMLFVSQRYRHHLASNAQRMSWWKWLFGRLRGRS